MNYQNYLKKGYRLLLVSLAIVGASGCVYILDPFTYKLAIQQGNVIEEKQVEMLEMGMTREQVAFVLGSPLIEDTFNSNRWDYFYRFKDSRGNITEDSLFVTFADNRLNQVGGSFVTKMKEKKNKSDGA